jgi:hypothetical protein
MVTFWGALVVLGVLLVGRYGADSRSDGDPTGRDPVWTDRPVRAHSPREDIALVAALGRRWVAHERAWEAFDQSLRPWAARH